MKKLLATLVIVTSAVSAFASDMTTMTTKPPVNFGVDFAMPYLLRANGNSVNDRGNFNMGVDGRYWLNENMNVGGRFAFDIENRGGGDRAVSFAPGTQYRWMPSEQFNPYVRADMPITFNGAAGNGGADLGISGGLGIAWNLGQAIGIENLRVRNDFNLAYNFGVGDAVSTLAIDFFRVGLDYRF